MAAQKALDLLIKIAGAVVAGIRSSNFTINSQTVDITSASSGGFRQSLGTGGITSMSLSGSGVFEDDAKFGEVNTAVLTRAIVACEIVVPEFGSYAGDFIITSLEMGGEHEAELTYTMSLESAGVVAFTPLP